MQFGKRFEGSDFVFFFFLQMLYTSFIAIEPEVSDLSGRDKARTEVITVHNDI